MLKAAVIGTGSMGRHHVRVYSSLPNVELIGIADINQEKVSQLSKAFNVPMYLNYQDILKLGVDLVSIAVPTTLHREVGVACCNKGIHCFVEKPIADTLENARELISAAEKNNVTLSIGHIENFNAAVIKLKEILQEEMLGTLLHISAKRVGPFVPRVKDIGIVVDSASHDISVIRYLLGKEPKSTFAKHQTVENKRGDYAVIVLDFGDVFASIEANWFTPHKIRNLIVTGTRGIAYLDYTTQKLRLILSEWEMIPKIEPKEPLLSEIEHFVDCIITKKKPLIDGHEALKTLEVALQCDVGGST